METCKSMKTEDKLNANFIKYIDRMEKYGCYSQRMVDDIGDKIKNAPFSMRDDSGGAYDGGLVDVVLNRMCRLAYDINTNAFGGERIKHPGLMVNTDMLIRVLLLQHLGKAEMFIPSPDEWKRKKGILYDFDDSLKTNLKLGERSLYLCQKYGITLNDEEYEAIRIIDREWDEKHLIMSSPLACVVRVVNVLTSIEIRHPNAKTQNCEKFW